MNKLRFHLGKGEHYMHWQRRHKDKGVEYINPEGYGATYVNVKLANRKSTAQKIHDGENKTVCAWVEFDYSWGRVPKGEYPNDLIELYYNPRNKPYWTSDLFDDIDLDGISFKYLVVEGRKLFVPRMDLIKAIETKYGKSWLDKIVVPF